MSWSLSGVSQSVGSSVQCCDACANPRYPFSHTIVWPSIPASPRPPRESVTQRRHCRRLRTSEIGCAAPFAIFDLQLQLRQLQRAEKSINLRSTAVTVATPPWPGRSSHTDNDERVLRAWLRRMPGDRTGMIDRRMLLLHNEHGKPASGDRTDDRRDGELPDRRLLTARVTEIIANFVGSSGDRISLLAARILGGPRSSSSLSPGMSFCES